MKLVTKSKLRENALIRSKPGIPDVRRISCAALAGALTKFTKRYLSGLVEIYGPPDIMEGAIGVSPTQLGYALRVTVDKLSHGKPISIHITEWDDEMNVRIEAAGLDTPDDVEAVVSAWRIAGFEPRGCGLTLRFSIPFEEALCFVVRRDNQALFDYSLSSGYYFDR